MKINLFFIFLPLYFFSQNIVYIQNFDSLYFGSVHTKEVFTENSQGKNEWKIGSHNGSTQGKYAKISGYKGGDIEEDWLYITLDLTNLYTAKVHFKTAIGYFKHDGLSVYLTDSIANKTNYQLIHPITLASKKDIDKNKFSAFIDSGFIDLTTYCGGIVYLVFLYKGNNTTESTLYEIDEIEVIGE